MNVVYFLWLCHLTLPLYSLVVHMGSDIKHDALPPTVRERLQTARTHYDQASLSHACIRAAVNVLMDGPSTSRDPHALRISISLPDIMTSHRAWHGAS